MSQRSRTTTDDLKQDKASIKPLSLQIRYQQLGDTHEELANLEEDRPNFSCDAPFTTGKRNDRQRINCNSNGTPCDDIRSYGIHSNYLRLEVAIRGRRSTMSLNLIRNL
ncbi:hypothetical protein ABW21_db0202320 [Orbilia brochopaga]|nr:hypothetical protein ABW21_db0202320 [Drechslerella brochopaga]